MRLSFACGDYDRVRALRDGRVRPEGVELEFLPLSPEEIFFRQMVHREFDVSELSLGSYVAGLHRNAGFIAIPVFPSRAFRHSAIYVNAGAGIAKPEDLRGKRVGVAEYQLTANVWVRGILEDEHGVHPRDIQWLTGGLEELGRREKVALRLPGDVRIEPIPEGETLSGMLERGDIDALVTPRLPGPFKRGAPSVRRLFADVRSVEVAYYKRTRIFPIMHTVVISRDIYDRDPWIAQSLTKALGEAKRLCAESLVETAAPASMLPWMHDELARVQELMGEDWWPYGIEPNRATLETFLRYARTQGITPNDIAVEDLFAKETLDTFKV
jgi:4,5-dihydroxyphthalate decarboxylase